MATDHNQTDKSSSFTDLLKLSPQQFDALAKLAEAMPPESADEADQREHKRKVIDTFKKGHVEFVDVQGSISKFIIFPTGISEGGISFLHGAFVHSDTNCKIKVPMPDGEVMAMKGVVRWCRLLKGRAHEIGVKYTTLLSKEVIDLYTSPPPPQQWIAGSATPTHNEKITESTSNSLALSPVVIKRLGVLTSALDEASSISDSIKTTIKDFLKEET